MKLCVDCRYHKTMLNMEFCSRRVTYEKSLVNGVMCEAGSSEPCVFERSEGKTIFEMSWQEMLECLLTPPKKCGPSGHYFKGKNEPVNIIA